MVVVVKNCCYHELLQLQFQPYGAAEASEASSEVVSVIEEELSASGIAYDAEAIGSAYGHVYTSVEPVEGLFPELKGVNPHYVEGAGPGVNTNCVSCANATDARSLWRDVSVVATPSKGYGTKNDLLSSVPFGFVDNLAVEQVKQKMLAFGSGESRVVVIQ